MGYYNVKYNKSEAIIQIKTKNYIAKYYYRCYIIHRTTKTVKLIGINKTGKAGANHEH
jgi:hypothetical protein